MAKDDYDYLVYRILLYLYGCFKRKYSFDIQCFNKTINADSIAEGYLVGILRNMENDGLIEGLIFKHAWGNDYIVANGIENATITSEGIHYLNENSRMKKFTNILFDGTGMVTNLAKMLLTI